MAVQWSTVKAAAPVDLRVGPEKEALLANLTEVFKTEAGRSLPAVPSYEALHFEDLISDTSALVDRCLLYRRELNELEILYVRTHYEYQLNTDLRKLDLQALDETSTVAISEESRAANEQAHMAFAAAADPVAKQLAGGFDQQAIGLASVAHLAGENEKSRQGLVRTRTQKLQDHDDKMNSRYSEYGNGHNYAQRYTRILYIVRQDFRQAYEKAVYASVGLKQVLGIDLPVNLAEARPADPDWEDLDYLDRLLHWVRDAINAVEKYTTNETEFEVVFPFRHSAGGSGPENLFTPDQFTANIDGNREFSFELKGNYFDRYEHIRLRTISLSIVTGNADNPNTVALRSLLRFGAIVLTPGAPSRSPVTLGQVWSLPYARESSVEGGSAILNVSPIGRWVVKLHQMFYPDMSLDKLSSHIVDVQLHLRVSAQVKAVATSG